MAEHFGATEPAKPFKRPAVVMNPAAGNGRVGKQRRFLRAALAGHLGGAAFYETESAGHAEELVRRALKKGHDRIVVVGGDGTYSEAVNGFFDGAAPVSPEAALAIVPWGTGSDLARTLGLPRGRAALPLAAGMQAVRADLGRIALSNEDGVPVFRHFINVIHAGLGGEVARRVNRASKRWGGRLSYLRSVCGALLTAQSRRIALDLDGEQLELMCLDIAVANGAFDGGGMRLAPHARLDDGLLDVICIGDVSRWEAFRQLKRIYNGTLAEHPQVLCRSVRRVEILGHAESAVNLDGDLCGVLPATIEAAPRAILLICG